MCEYGSSVYSVGCCGSANRSRNILSLQFESHLSITISLQMFAGESVDDISLLSLLAACSLEDADDIRGRRKGKARGGPLSDEELALELFAEEARTLEILAQDMLLARSIDRAIREDVVLLDAYARTEEMERSDREIARAIAEGRPPPTRTATPVQTVSPEAAAPAAAFANVTATTSSSNRSSVTSSILFMGPSSSSKKLPNKSRVRLESCVICRDDIQGPVIHAPCGDAYDIECLVDLFRAAMVDESLFPPACCRQQFDIATVRPYLSRDLSALYDKKAVEFRTKNRVYCHRPTCSTFLGEATTSASNLYCVECWAQTCGHCKKAAHSILTRCESEEDAAVVALAEESGWKRCPGCGHLVELTIGCYHMTCRCRHQFCYLCTATWKTCRCDQWDEDRLVHAAQDRVERQQRVQVAGAGPAVRPAEYRRVVEQEVARLRNNHDCVHRWRYVSGGGNCDGCGHYLRLFLFNCTGCQIWACARCRRNRWLW
ncbi:hypothetical protein C8Q76DRAFT_712045 [Earliella scabrosa]|nr:hypothetical protein C8Q76DRAFT_712045 [Earliella scabrosa]